MKSLKQIDNEARKQAFEYSVKYVHPNIDPREQYGDVFIGEWKDDLIEIGMQLTIPPDLRDRVSFASTGSGEEKVTAWLYTGTDGSKQVYKTPDDLIHAYLRGR